MKTPSLPLVATSTQGTFIAYDSEVTAGSPGEFVLARLDEAGAPVVVERFSTLPGPIAIAATGATVHVLGAGGNEYFTVAVSER